MKANVKLMNDILSEMKGWMLHDDNSLAKTLPRLQARIKDFDKLAIKLDDDPYNSRGMVGGRLSQINGLFCDLESFQRYFGEILRSIRSLQESIERIADVERNTDLPEWFCDEQARQESLCNFRNNEETVKRVLAEKI